MSLGFSSWEWGQRTGHIAVSGVVFLYLLGGVVDVLWDYFLW